MTERDYWLINEVLAVAFDERTWDQGDDLQLDGKVQGYDVRKALGVLQITGTVKRTATQSFQVAAQIYSNGSEDPVLDGQCTCPVGNNCLHVAAVLIEASESDPDLPFMDDLDEDGDGLAKPGRSVNEPPKPLLEPPIAEWVRRLGEAALLELDSSANEYPPQESRRLLFILKAQNNALRVSPTVVQVTSKGLFQYGRKSNIDYFLYENAQTTFVLPVDTAILRQLKASHSAFGGWSNIALDAESGAGLLKKMLATGRCYFRGFGKAHPALALGPVRSAKPVWTADQKGRQTSSFLVDPPTGQILPLSPPWYADETTATCGPLETGLPPSVAVAWLQAPPVPPNQANMLAAEFSRQPSALGLPSPSPIETEEIRSQRPAPCLRLSSTVASPYYSAFRPNRNSMTPDSITVHLAELTFDYGGWRVPPTETVRIQEEFRDGKLCRLHRNLKEEALAEECLYDIGFEGARSVFYEYNLDRRENRLTLREPMAWFEFVHRRVPELREKGWQIEIDSDFQLRIATPESWYADADSLQGGNDWFGAELGVMLNGQKINLLPILMNAFQSRPGQLNADSLAQMPEDASLPVPLPDGRTLGFPVRRLREMMGVLLELLDADSLSPQGRLKLSKLRAAELSGMADSAEWRWLGNAELRALSEKLRGFESIRPVPVPSGLLASLRPYQRDGLNWLQFLREYDLAGILADDMGLGKTVQALAHLLVEKESGRMDRPSLVVAPTSLMTNWRQEAERFAPGLRALVLHGLGRKQHFDRLSEHDLILTTYALLPRDQSVLLEQEFHCVILDEAQYIKNPKTLYAQIAGQLKARHHLCLTGTPMENHLGELWSQFNFLLPGFLADEKRFNFIFRRPIEKANNEDRRTLLSRRVAPFILRRRKGEVAKELPPKTEIVQNVELDGPQRDLYESIRLAMHERVKAEVDKKGINRAHIIILDALLKLRQVCCHPQLLSLPSARNVKQSAKLDLLMDLLPGMIDEGRRVLLFSQFTSMLALIEAALAKVKIPYVLLTGKTRDRETPVRRFQDGEIPLFLISLKAGGTGLNLTAADTVIHYDPWWNPAVENQATDRAHRIGQEKSVFVYKLMTVGTVEEKIGEMQARKRELVERLLDEGRKQGPQLTAEDIDILFAPLQ